MKKTVWAHYALEFKQEAMNRESAQPRGSAMRKSRYTDEQIIGFIKQSDAGMSVADLCRREGFSSATFYMYGLPVECNGLGARLLG